MPMPQETQEVQESQEIQKTGAVCKPMGRPREFSCETALDRAMDVFWRHGYEGASLSALTEAMGINRPSLYAAFGDKQSLFLKVLDRYEEAPLAFVAEALAQPTARALAEHILLGVVTHATDPAHPPGCLTLQAGLAGSTGNAAIQAELRRRLAATEDILRERLQRARAEGDLPPDAKPAELARYLTVVQRGLCIQAAGGATRSELRAVARIALSAWPV